MGVGNGTSSQLRFCTPTTYKRPGTRNTWHVCDTRGHLSKAQLTILLLANTQYYVQLIPQSVPLIYLWLLDDATCETPNGSVGAWPYLSPVIRYTSIQVV